MIRAWPRALSRAAHQARLGNLVHALELLSVAWPPEDAEGRYHLDRLALWLAERISPSQHPSALAERLALPQKAREALMRAREAEKAAIGHVPLALLDTGSGEAFVARLEVKRGGARLGLEPTYGESWRRAIGRVEETLWRILARGLIEPKLFGQGLRYELHCAAPLEAVDGSSVAGAALLGAFSLLVGRAIPVDLMVLAELDTKGALRAVGGRATKLRTIARELPAVSRIVAPDHPELGEESSPRAELELVEVAGAEELLRLAFGEGALRAPPDEAINLEANLLRGIALYEKEGAAVAAAALLQQVLALISSRRAAREDDALYRREEFLALWRTAAARSQLGDVAGALALVERTAPLASDLWRTERIDATSYLGFNGTRALVLRDTFRFEEAEALLEESLEQQRKMRVGKREMARTLGNLGELRTFSRRFAAAEEALTQALAYLEEAYVEEVPRALCYLGNLALARGDISGALERYADGLRRNQGVEIAAAINESYLRYGQLRALFRCDAFREVETLATETLSAIDPQRPYPRQMILMIRGRARLALGQREAGYEDLERSTRHEAAEGALMRFGLALGHLHRARKLIAEGATERLEAIREACEPLRHALLSLAAYPRRDQYDAALKTLVEELPQSAEGLDQALAEILAHFPY